MPFKKLHSNIKEKLSDLEIVTPTPFQSKSIPVIKGGANVYCTASENSGKTTTLILTTLHKLKCEVVGDNPRAIVLVENKEKVLALYDAFKKFIQFNTLRLYASYEQLDIEIQKSEIFEGVDILISTPVAMNKLLLLNGISTSQIKIVSIDDAQFLDKQVVAYNAVMAITTSIAKCQYVLYAEKMTPKLKRFEDFFMEYSKKINL